MPTYEYKCDACGHRFDEFQSFTEEPLKICPECKEERLRRLFGTGAAILFKGSGFYETDYRSESYKQGQKAEESIKGGGSNGTDSAGGKNGTATPAKAESGAKTAASDFKSAD